MTTPSLAPPAPRQPLPVLRAAELEPETPERRWLLRELWGLAAVGVIGGAPKCCLSRARHKQHYAAFRVMPRGWRTLAVVLPSGHGLRGIIRSRFLTGE